MKNLFADKKIGFWFTLCTAALTLITAIVYRAIYQGSNYLSVLAFWLLIGGAVVSVALLFVGLERFAPAVLFAAVTVAFCYYIYYIYFYISSAAYGIQTTFTAPFFVNAAFFVLTLIACFVLIFIPHKAEEQ
ncbi:MAG: hypothetical protein ILP12_01595 [Lachnospiraceae bacterium]|nr:hypothetical protein [Lachnospiraceae bacterium]